MKTLTLTLGQYETSQAYLEAIKKTRSVSQWAEEIILKVPLSKKKKTIEVSLLTFADLGLSGTQTTQQIKDAAQTKGYSLPDAEIALALALEEQEIGEWWITLHEPIIDSVGGPNVLETSRDGVGRWVYADFGRPLGRWYDGGAFAFLVPASVPSDTLPLELQVEITIKEQSYVGTLKQK